MSSKYSDDADILSFNLAIELPENTNIKKHVIKYVEVSNNPIDLYIL